MRFEADPARSIPVLRPMLPHAEQIQPYLVRIDFSRVYSNFGPLATEFAARLSDMLGVPPNAVLATNSGTSALTAAILATVDLDDAERRSALMPSFTFVATATAAERCGLKPYFVDIEPTTWAIDPDQLIGHPVLDQVAIVIPVAPFGRPLHQKAWANFQAKTGIPVVFDDAAAFAVIGESHEDFVGSIPTAFSFHATKSLGIGEGGCVVCTDVDRLKKITACLNFGFDGTRDSAVPSTNGKMSEYAAAVGLAALDEWSAKRQTIQQTALEYRRAFAHVGLESRFMSCPDVDGNYALFQGGSEDEVETVRHSFESEQIEYRFWYGNGVHRHTHFASAPRDALPRTEKLGRTLLGMPMAPDLTPESMARITQACRRALSQESPRGSGPARTTSPRLRAPVFEKPAL